MKELNWFQKKWYRFIFFLESLINYLRLYREGFSISRSTPLQSGRIFRFWWKEQLLEDFPDITVVHDHYITSRMSGRVIYLRKRYEHHNDPS